MKVENIKKIQYVMSQLEEPTMLEIRANGIITQLLNKIKEIGDYAYKKHCASKTNAHNDLYAIAEMCREENI